MGVAVGAKVVGVVVVVSVVVGVVTWQPTKPLRSTAFVARVRSSATSTQVDPSAKSVSPRQNRPSAGAPGPANSVTAADSVAATELQFGVESTEFNPRKPSAQPTVSVVAGSSHCCSTALSASACRELPALHTPTWSPASPPVLTCSTPIWNVASTEQLYSTESGVVDVVVLDVSVVVGVVTSQSWNPSRSKASIIEDTVDAIWSHWFEATSSDSANAQLIVTGLLPGPANSLTAVAIAVAVASQVEPDPTESIASSDVKLSPTSAQITLPTG